MLDKCLVSVCWCERLVGDSRMSPIIIRWSIELKLPTGEKADDYICY